MLDSIHSKPEKTVSLTLEKRIKDGVVDIRDVLQKFIIVLFASGPEHNEDTGRFHVSSMGPYVDKAGVDDAWRAEFMRLLRYSIDAQKTGSGRYTVWTFPDQETCEHNIRQLDIDTALMRVKEYISRSRAKTEKKRLKQKASGQPKSKEKIVTRRSGEDVASANATPLPVEKELGAAGVWEALLNMARAMYVSSVPEFVGGERQDVYRGSVEGEIVPSCGIEGKYAKYLTLMLGYIGFAKYHNTGPASSFWELHTDNPEAFFAELDAETTLSTFTVDYRAKRRESDARYRTKKATEAFAESTASTPATTVLSGEKTSVPQAPAKTDRISSTQLEEFTALFEQLRGVIDDRGKTIAKIQTLSSERAAHIEQQDKLLAELRQQIDQLTTDLVAARAEITELEAQLSNDAEMLLAEVREFTTSVQ